MARECPRAVPLPHIGTETRTESVRLRTQLRARRRQCRTARAPSTWPKAVEATSARVLCVAAPTGVAAGRYPAALRDVSASGIEGATAALRSPEPKPDVTAVPMAAQPPEPVPDRRRPSRRPPTTGVLDVLRQLGACRRRHTAYDGNARALCSSACRSVRESSTSRSATRWARPAARSWHPRRSFTPPTSRRWPKSRSSFRCSRSA